MLAALVVACAARRPLEPPPPPRVETADAGLPWVRYSPEELAKVKNAHDYKGLPACQLCHAHETPMLLAGPAHTCERCHRNARHSPGHEAGTKLPPERVKGLPMENGVVICHTCHATHDLKQFRYGLRAPVNEVCLACHAKH